jgi:hypothetical protein
MLKKGRGLIALTLRPHFGIDGAYLVGIACAFHDAYLSK